MTEQQEAAMRLALEALAAYMSATDEDEDAKAHSLMASAFFKLKEALEQPAQQWCACEPTECNGVGRCRWQAMNYSPLDKQPAQQDSLCMRAQGKRYPHACERCGFGSCIGEPVKPTQQEPYLSKAYRLANELREHLSIAPAREWVGLTDEEKLAIKFANSSMGVFCINYDLNKMLSDAEAKLREKNA